MTISYRNDSHCHCCCYCSCSLALSDVSPPALLPGPACRACEGQSSVFQGCHAEGWGQHRQRQVHHSPRLDTEDANHSTSQMSCLSARGPDQLASKRRVLHFISTVGRTWPRVRSVASRHRHDHTVLLLSVRLRTCIHVCYTAPYSIIVLRALQYSTFVQLADVRQSPSQYRSIYHKAVTDYAPCTK